MTSIHSVLSASPNTTGEGTVRPAHRRWNADAETTPWITTAAVLFARPTAAEQEAEPQNRDGNLTPQRERYQPP
jgi:hypothetical protein